MNIVNNIKKLSILILAFIAINSIFYFSLCISNDILFCLFKSGLWYTIFQLCKEVILLFQILVGYILAIFTVFIQ
ncbi:hypothetical protein Calkro_2563 [Caldicellulosiruptor kronotskyensis 2002]|uniref:Uncharacterized protein n=1 Tax=Caldicellulosiruptor kronotskyensis (strain DSM 18902 / VKM B-2412 / 2002) TaxID=632348 RepID=E4SHY8_CALK2|nr:hypothetical protein [Caldicellulosiruptor kronotskyensis]ADQ47363.1 hypothetical protein Calkro_2563 [Caldicellulosiruptor kronotskyensis 2002]